MPVDPVIYKICKKIEEREHKFGRDENFKNACVFHLLKFERYHDKTKDNNRTLEDHYNLFMSTLFLCNIELYPTRKFLYSFGTNKSTNWPIPLIPPEFFAENDTTTAAVRKTVFYICLRVGDCLICKILNNFSSEYELKVFHKYGANRILDNLNIIVKMRKADISELPGSLAEFQINTLLRVVVTEIRELETEGDKEVFVSLIDNNKNLQPLRPLVTEIRNQETGEDKDISVPLVDNYKDVLQSLRPLGVISIDQVPKYLLSKPKHTRATSYKEYLTGYPVFFNPVTLNSAYEGLGVNTRETYSYFPINERLKSLDINEVLRKGKQDHVTHLKEEALKFDTRDFTIALEMINKAIGICPKPSTDGEKAELSKLYEIRGNIQLSKSWPSATQEVIEDLNKAVKIDFTNESAKNRLFQLLLTAANMFYEKKGYKYAAEYASKALTLVEDAKLRKMIECCKKRPEYPAFDPKDLTLTDLIENKKAIIDELERLPSEERVRPLVPY